MSRALVSHIEIAAGLLLVPGQQCMNPVLRDGLEEPVWSTECSAVCACLAMSYKHTDWGKSMEPED